MQGFNFSERVRKVLAMAREEAMRLRHEYVGPEHLLLALLREGGGVANGALVELGIDTPSLVEQVESLVAQREPSARSLGAGDLPYTTRAKRTLELSMAEARDLHHGYLGTEHLLLGLIREERGIAAQVLIAAGAHPDATREAVRRLLGVASPEAMAAHAADTPARRARVASVVGAGHAPLVSIIIRSRDGTASVEEFTSVADAALFLQLLEQRGM